MRCGLITIRRMLRVGLFVQSLSLRKITECIEYKHHSIRRFKGVKGTKNVESDCVSFWGDSFGSGDVPIWVVGAAAGGANSVRCDDIRRLLTMYLCMLYIVFIVLPLWRNTDSPGTRDKCGCKRLISFIIISISTSHARVGH